MSEEALLILASWLRGAGQPWLTNFLSFLEGMGRPEPASGAEQLLAFPCLNDNQTEDDR
jgi:hypothetical protein